MQEDIFTLLLIIWSQRLDYCFRFWQVGVVIIMILRASFLLSKCQNFRCFGVLPGGEFAD